MSDRNRFVADYTARIIVGRVIDRRIVDNQTVIRRSNDSIHILS